MCFTIHILFWPRLRMWKQGNVRFQTREEPMAFSFHPPQLPCGHLHSKPAPETSSSGHFRRPCTGIASLWSVSRNFDKTYKETVSTHFFPWRKETKHGESHRSLGSLPGGNQSPPAGDEGAESGGWGPGQSSGRKNALQSGSSGNQPNAPWTLAAGRSGAQPAGKLHEAPWRRPGRCERSDSPSAPSRKDLLRSNHPGWKLLAEHAGHSGKTTEERPLTHWEPRAQQEIGLHPSSADRVLRWSPVPCLCHTCLGQLPPPDREVSLCII